jgi:hypothetical protein
VGVDRSRARGLLIGLAVAAVVSTAVRLFLPWAAPVSDGPVPGYDVSFRPAHVAASVVGWIAAMWAVVELDGWWSRRRAQRARAHENEAAAAT